MIHAIVVIYNKKCEDSVTIKTLLKYKKKINIYIFDNSTIPNNNMEFCKNELIYYFTLNKNVGLPAAYNYVIGKINKNDKDYVLILDDDTILNDNYFAELFSLTSDNEYDVILPVVKSNHQIISPSNIQFGCRVKRVSSVNKIRKDKVTAINSGMAIKVKIYDFIKYDEAMFLDYVDHMFMKKIREGSFSVFIMNSIILQNFSRNEKQKIEAVKFRYNLFKKDYKYYCYNCNKKLFFYLSLLKYKLIVFLKYKKFI